MMMWHATSLRLSLQFMVILRTLPHHQICLQIVMEATTSLTLLAPAYNYPDTLQSTSQHNVDIQVKAFPIFVPWGGQYLEEVHTKMKMK